MSWGDELLKKKESGDNSKKWLKTEPVLNLNSLREAYASLSSLSSWGGTVTQASYPSYFYSQSPIGYSQG